MAAPLLLKVSKAVAAEFTGEVQDNSVGSVVSNDVVRAITEELDTPTHYEFAGFLVHQISTIHWQPKPSGTYGLCKTTVSMPINLC